MINVADMTKANMQHSSSIDQLQNAVADLMANLGRERVIQLAELLKEVQSQNDGYGNITIVICDRRVERIKQEFQFK